jgi:cyanophycinase
LIGDHTQGLGFLRNSVIDQHLLARNRQFDLVDFMNMAPNYLGLGIDESTAAIVVRDVLEVMGSSLVAIYNTQDKPFFFLRNGQKFDLNERKVIRQNQNQ